MSRARRAGPHRHRDQPGHQHRLHRRDERRRELHHHQRADWRLRHRRGARGSRASSRRSRSRRRRRRASTSGWRSAPSRSGSRSSSTGAVLQTENAVVGNKRRARSDREAAGPGPQPRRRVALYTAGATRPNPGQFNSLRAAAGGPSSTASASRPTTSRSTASTSNEAINNGIAYQPSPDAVEQVSVETNNYSAELGNVAGAIVNMVIKSGTNRFSGNALLLLARQQARGDAVGHQPRRRQEGGVLAQHLRRHGRRPDGRATSCSSSRDYQGGRQETPPADAFATVVPDEWRQGDLSSLLARNIVIRDPLTGQPFPNNQIPVEPLQPVRAEPVRRRDALSAGQRRASAQRLPRTTTAARPRRRAGRTSSTGRWTGTPRRATSCTCAIRGRRPSRSHDADGDAAGRSRRRPNNPFWGVGANWNRIIGTALVNDLLVGYSDTLQLSEPLDSSGSATLNNQLGIPGAQPIRGPDRRSDRQRRHEHRQRRDRHQQLQHRCTRSTSGSRGCAAATR